MILRHIVNVFIDMPRKIDQYPFGRQALRRQSDRDRHSMRTFQRRDDPLEFRYVENVLITSSPGIVATELRPVACSTAISGPMPG